MMEPPGKASSGSASSASPGAADAGWLRACAYPLPWRIVAGTLVAVSRASLPAILALVLVSNDPPVTPPVLVKLVVTFALLPGLAAWLVARAFPAEVEIRAGELVVRRRDVRIEVPCASIERVVPWVVPLPGAGLSLRLRTGRFRWGLQCPDPTLLVASLASAGVAAARAAPAHPSLVHARARSAVAPRRWHHRLGKFVLFALLPAAVLFNVHQYIAYGGTFGEYYLVGLAAWLRTFAVYWLTTSIYLVLYASVWRGAAEAAAFLAAWTAPSRAAGVRRLAETACQVGYYAGVPVLLGLRFLS